MQRRSDRTDFKLNLQYFATIPNEKLTEYALNPEHPVGKYKAVVFEKVLGYNLNNYKDLKKQILENFDEERLSYQREDRFGKRYCGAISITGPNGNTADVMTAWIKENDGAEPKLVSLYLTEKKL